MEDIPNIFFPMVFRHSVKNRSLQDHVFTSAEKRWVCQTLLMQCIDIETELDAMIRVFCKRHNISVKLVVQWFDIFAELEDFD